jgi:hypothetical protein
MFQVANEALMGMKNLGVQIIDPEIKRLPQRPASRKIVSSKRKVMQSNSGSWPKLISFPLSTAFHDFTQ